MKQIDFEQQLPKQAEKERRTGKIDDMRLDKIDNTRPDMIKKVERQTWVEVTS